MSNIPTVSLGVCNYNKERRVLKLSGEYIGMPHQFFVRSHVTGKDVRFVAVDENDVLFDQDGWDGEMCIYRPVGNVPTIDHMIIHNFY